MIINLHDLNPRRSELKLKDKVYTLKPFTLSTRVWVESEFSTKDNKSGLENFSKMLGAIETNPDKALRAASILCFRLLEDRSDFKDVDDFIDRHENYNNLGSMYKSICEVIGLSEPQISELEKEQLEVKKPQAVSL